MLTMRGLAVQQRGLLWVAAHAAPSNFKLAVDPFMLAIALLRCTRISECPQAVLLLRMLAVLVAPCSPHLPEPDEQQCLRDTVPSQSSKPQSDVVASAMTESCHDQCQRVLQQVLALCTGIKLTPSSMQAPVGRALKLIRDCMSI